MYLYICIYRLNFWIQFSFLVFLNWSLVLYYSYFYVLNIKIDIEQIKKTYAYFQVTLIAFLLILNSWIF